MALFDVWLDLLAYTDFPRELFQAGTDAGTRPYASEIEEMLAQESGIGAQAVFCVDDVPSVCIIDGTSLGIARDERILQIRQRVWNQALASVVLVVDPNQVSAYSVNDRIAPPELLSSRQADRHGRWSAYEVQAGFIQDRLPDWFSPERRVDHRLLANLREAVLRLSKLQMSKSQAEALMAQIIFLCYLEQRGIIGDSYRQTHNLEELNSYISRYDGAGVERLLSQLGRDLNGDFLNLESSGTPTWSLLHKKAFDVLSQFLSAVDLDTGQGAFWRYDFSHIPVELISSIYETLLKDRQGELGAYYTPRHLATLVVTQAFENVNDPSNCTVYDGASGSGILLTTAFRKMLRVAEVRNGRRLRLQERIDLMLRNIFGSDVDETACSITAFSLYLSLLEGLEPADISLLQTNSSVSLPRLVGDGLNIRKGAVQGEFFSDQNPFAASERFDVFVCNPPWRESEDKESPLWEEWLSKQDPPYPVGRRQIAAGFAYRALHSVHPNGTVVLIVPLNLMIGATRQSCEFRQRWLEEARIERIINFGDIRHLVFPAAKHPCCVVRVRPRSSDEGIVIPSDEVIEYWTPKSDVSLALGRIALHPVDKKVLPTRTVFDRPYSLISTYWGERRDLDLLTRLQKLGSLRKTMNSRQPPWLSGKGFHAPNQSNPDRGLGLLEGLSYLPANRIPAGHPVVSIDAAFEPVSERFKIVASPGGRNGQLYSGPRLLFTDGLLPDYRVRAVYSELTFAFQSSVGAIGSSARDAALIKFLTAYLRSPLASYLLIMTGYSVIGERPRIAVDDVEALPFCSPEEHPRPAQARELVKEVGVILDGMANIPEWRRDHAYSEVRGELDNIVYEYFGLTKTDRILVEDTSQFVAKSIQPSTYEHISTPLLSKPSDSEVGAYIETLHKELISWRERRRGVGVLSVDAIVDGTGGCFGAVRVALRHASTDEVSAVSSSAAFQYMLNDLNAALKNEVAATERGDLFKTPNVLILAGDVFYYVKPLRRRFWLRRTALSDADHIALTVQSAAWHQAYR